METLHDADFTDQDIDAALEWQHEQSLICTGCGHPLDETTDEDLKTAWITERVICWSCAAKERTTANTDGKSRGPWGARYWTRNRARD